MTKYPELGVVAGSAPVKVFRGVLNFTLGSKSGKRRALKWKGKGFNCQTLSGMYVLGIAHGQGNNYNREEILKTCDLSLRGRKRVAWNNEKSSRRLSDPKS